MKYCEMFFEVDFLMKYFEMFFEIIWLYDILIWLFKSLIFFKLKSDIYFEMIMKLECNMKYCEMFSEIKRVCEKFKRFLNLNWHMNYIEMAFEKFDLLYNLIRACSYLI